MRDWVNHAEMWRTSKAIFFFRFVLTWEKIISDGIK